MQAKRPEAIRTNLKRQSTESFGRHHNDHNDAESGRLTGFGDITPVEHKITSDSPKRANEHLTLNVKKYIVDPDHTSTFLKLSPSDPIRVSKESRFDFRGSHIMTIDEIEGRMKHKKRSAKGPLSLPKKHVFLAACLLIVGIIALIIGTAYAVNSNDPHKGIAFWIIGGLCVLPGMFSTWTLCKVCYARNNDARRRALEIVPKE